MGRGHEFEAGAAAFQILQQLEHYEDEFERPPHGEARLEQIRLCMLAAPTLVSAWTALLIARAEWSHCRLQVFQQSRPLVDLAMAQERHRDAVQALRVKCRRLLTHDDDAPR